MKRIDISGCISGLLQGIVAEAIGSACQENQQLKPKSGEHDTASINVSSWVCKWSGIWRITDYDGEEQWMTFKYTKRRDKRDKANRKNNTHRSTKLTEFGDHVVPGFFADDRVQLLKHASAF